MNGFSDWTMGVNRSFDCLNFVTHVGNDVEDWASQHGKITEEGRSRYDLLEKCNLKASWNRYV